MAAKGNGSGGVINNNTTLSISLVSAIVAASLAIGVQYAQIGSLQQQLANHMIANTTSIQRMEKDIDRVDHKSVQREALEEYKKHIDDINQELRRRVDRIENAVIKVPEK